jgi:ABC-type phosphate/phosphonate transport system substrate-binding protein
MKLRPGAALLLALGVLGVAALASTGRAVAHPHGEPLLIGLAPQQDPAKVYQMMQPFVQYLEREVSYKFTFETAPSIEEFQRRVLEGRYDVWWGNPLTYIQANRTIGYVAIARDTGRIAGLLVTRKDGPSTAKDLAGKKIAYSAPDAIGATLLVRDYLITSGVPADAVKVVYTGTHDSAYRAVLDGHADAAGGVPRSFAALDATDRDRLQIIGRTVEVAPQPFAVHPHLYRQWVVKIQRALIKLNWVPEGKDILSTMQFKEIVVSNDVDYDFHRELAKRLRIAF